MNYSTRLQIYRSPPTFWLLTWEKRNSFSCCRVADQTSLCSWWLERTETCDLVHKHFHIAGATVVCALPTDIIISKSIEILCSHFTQLPSKIVRGGGRVWGGSVTAWTNKVSGMFCMQILHCCDYGPICQLGDWVGCVWKLLPVVCISFIISPLLTTSLQGWHSISNAPWPLSLHRDTTKSMVDLEVLYSCEGRQSLDYIDCAQKWLQICVCLTNSASTNLHCHPAGGKWGAHSLHRGKGWSSSAWLEICYWCTAPWPHFPPRSLASRVSVAILERMVVP